jgi:hypothetical protein
VVHFNDAVQFDFQSQISLTRKTAKQQETLHSVHIIIYAFQAGKQAIICSIQVFISCIQVVCLNANVFGLNFCP